MSSILVTGGAGFIGSHITEELLLDKTVESIVILDNLSTGKMDNIPQDNRIHFVKGDVTNNTLIRDLIDQYNFDTVFHLAAIADVQYSIDNPVKSHQVNFDSTLELIETLRYKKGMKRFVFASSAAVYGNKPNLPCRETDPVNPISQYGVDKYASERTVLNASLLYNVPSTAFRFFNVYGLRQNASSPYSGVISIFMDRILNNKGTITIYGDGEQSRDFIYVKDLVKAVLNIISKNKSIGKVYNIGSGIQTTLNRLLDVIQKLSGKQVDIHYEPERKGDIRHSLASIDKLIELGYNAKMRDISEGLKAFME